MQSGGGLSPPYDLAVFGYMSYSFTIKSFKLDCLVASVADAKTIKIGTTDDDYRSVHSSKMSEGFCLLSDIF